MVDQSPDGVGTRGAPGPALHRVLREPGAPGVLGLLAEELSGADLTTLLLAALRIRAGRLHPPDVLRRHSHDRFTAPGTVAFASLRRAEDVLLSALPDGYEVLTLSPVVPLGTHSAVATVDQNNVVATIRGTEVAADPTNGLALEAAGRRARELGRERRSAAAVRLAAIQRVVRAQRVDAPVSFSHFQLFGMVSAGRDTGNRSFEVAHAAEHLRFAAAVVRALGPAGGEIRLTAFQSALRPVVDEVRAELAGLAGFAGVRLVDDPGRRTGRGYYAGLCFKVLVDLAGELCEIADGGLVDWTQKLLGNRKERLFISGYGVDRLALALESAAGRSPGAGPGPAAGSGPG